MSFLDRMKALRWHGHARRLVAALMQAGVLHQIDAHTHRHGRGPFLRNCIRVVAREFHNDDPRDVPIPAMVAVAAALANKEAIAIEKQPDFHYGYACACKPSCRWNKFDRSAQQVFSVPYTLGEQERREKAARSWPNGRAPRP